MVDNGTVNSPASPLDESQQQPDPAEPDTDSPAVERTERDRRTASFSILHRLPPRLQTAWADPAARLGFFVLAAGTLIVFWKMHGFKLPTEIAQERAAAAGRQGPKSTLFRSITDWLRPWAWGRGDLLKVSTATGGDMGAHVWSSNFVQRSLFPKGRLTGWSDDWFFGMPVLGFYFPLPTLVIASLGKIIPTQIAFKLITVTGILTLPAASWGSGRLARLPRPIPTLMGLAAFVFLFARNYDLFIYGGNILSTMAGEFSFSISLSLAILFLGSYVRVLRTGEGRGRTALLLAATGLCHLLPTMWAGVTAVLLTLAFLDTTKLRPKNLRLLLTVLGGGALAAAVVFLTVDKNIGLIVFGLVIGVLALFDEITRRFDLPQMRDAILTLATGGATAGFWLVPFKFNLPYTNDMGWEKSTRYVKFLFPFWQGKGGKPYGDSQLIAVAMIFGVIGAAYALGTLAVAMRRRAEDGGLWSPIGMPIAVILSCIFGLILGAARSSTGAGVAGVLGGLLVAFLLLVAMAERDRTQQLVLLIATVFPAGVALLQWGARPGLIVLSVLPLVAVVLVFAALNQLDYERWAVAWVAMLAACAAIFVLSPQFRLWNARVLPFWFFGNLIFSAYGAVRAVHLLKAGIGRYAEWKRPLRNSTTWGVGLAALYTFVGVGLPLNLVPNSLPIPRVNKGAIGVQLAKKSTDSSQTTGWSGYNYKGYEGQGAWKEYKALMDEANRVGKTNGCGRALWEYEDSKLGSFGTTLSLMLFPYWTKGCIGSIEGVYFESSASAPYHWMTAGLATAPTTNDEAGNKKYSGPSNPQRDLPYQPFDLVKAVKKMQASGVRYYVALTDIAKNAAAQIADLKKVGESGVFAFYEVQNSSIVSPLTEQPVIVKGIDQDQFGGWLDVEMDWYNNPDRYPATIAWSGPSSWNTMKATVKKPENTRTFGAGVVVDQPQKVSLDPVVVSNVSKDNVNIRFSVDKVGVPVLVKSSYFPNWKADGAKGPYRVMPNFMVVIPTSKNVHLHYGYSKWDYLGYLLTITGLIMAFVLHRRTRRREFLVPDPERSVLQDRSVSQDPGSAATGAAPESDTGNTSYAYGLPLDDAEPVIGSENNATPK